MPVREGKRNVLVVEDVELNREILKEILADNYTVLQAENGKEGLEKLEKYGNKISLVLLDIQMPVMNGYEFLHALQGKPHFANIPVIVMTSRDSLSDEINCLENGASDFLTKPYNSEVVLRRAASMIRLSEASAMLNKVEYDALTGVYSKEFFFEHASRVLESNPEGEFDVFCCDVASFKMINDRYGVENGDQLLRFIAGKMKDNMSDRAVIGRISGDIFAALCRHHEFEAYQRQVTKFSNSLASEGPVPNVSVCFGVYANIPRSISVSIACDNALLAISSIKHQYGTKVAMYDEAIRKKLQREQLIVDYMETALKERQFQVYFQPKHHLAKNQTGGAEALVRWIHPEMGFLSPGEFIPLFEKNGFITKMDAYMLEESCKILREWMNLGKPVVPVSFNISRVDFEQKDPVKAIQMIADRYEVPYRLLHVEVTESAYIENPEQLVEKVWQLKTAGFGIELDDFGSGYTSLNVLNELQPNVLKLDMSIVRSMNQGKQKIILRHILEMARSLDMEVVAEGVETREQAEELRRMGCTFAQGYFYSRPLPRDQFEDYLACSFGLKGTMKEGFGDEKKL